MFLGMKRAENMEEIEKEVLGLNGQEPIQDSQQRQRPELILPSGYVEYSQTARKMFPVLAKRLRFFVRGYALVEIAYQKPLKDKQLHDIFQLLEADALRSRIEKDFTCRVWREENHKYVLKPGRCTGDTAKVLLKTDEAFEFLPSINTLSAAPLLTGEQRKLEILAKGYHGIHGGIFVSHGDRVPLPELGEAKRLILEAVADFDFVSEADKSRAVASFIRPALRAGRLLGDADFPIDIREANESQSGKTFRQKLVCAVYRETPYVIASRDGGVGSLDESISSALIAGIPFIFFENFRGQMKSQLIETCLRGLGWAPARAPHKGEIQVPTAHINWQLSSNGLEATRDFVNRAIISRICKRDAGHSFKQYPNGNILSHIKANQTLYLGAVFRIIKEWDRRGRPATDEKRHDFREWAQALDWIVQNLFELPPLIDGHSEEVLRVSDPALSWLRQVSIVIEKTNRLDQAYSASEIVDICQVKGIELPSTRGMINSDQLSMHGGRMLTRVFSDQEKVEIDRYQIRRETRTEYRQRDGQPFEKHYYWFGKRGTSNVENVEPGKFIKTPKPENFEKL
jgi:hypothetical protein